MARVKSSVPSRKRRKKILKLAKGYFGSKRTLFRTANEQVMRSLRYSYIGRKQRKRDFRKLWIQRINAACRLNGTKYSTFIYGLALANVTVNRKMLADLAVNDPNGFKNLVEVANQARFDNPNGKQAAVNGSAKVAEKHADLNLESLTVAELKALAQEKNLSGYSAMKKADLIAALKN